jgi:hypothetical protein
MNFTQYLIIFAFLAFESPCQALFDRWQLPNGFPNAPKARTDGYQHAKRALPRIGTGFTGQEQIQITRGWKDACTLAVFALRAVGKLPPLPHRYYMSPLPPPMNE